MCTLCVCVRAHSVCVHSGIFLGVCVSVRANLCLFVRVCSVYKHVVVNRFVDTFPHSSHVR